MKAVILAGGFGTRISEESVMKVGITYGMILQRLFLKSIIILFNNTH